MQRATAQFITKSGFATGLTPSVTISEVKTWTVNWTFDMIEVTPWNYTYEYIDWSDQVLYFFNYDAKSDAVLNRYQWGTNVIENTRWWGWGITTVRNNVINKEQMERIAEIVIEKLPKQDVVTFDTKNIEERLGLIEMKINESVVEFDYDTILSSVEDNALKISKAINSIKIPKIDNKPIIDAIKSIEKELPEIKEQTKKIKTKREELLDKLSDDIEEMWLQDELESLVDAPVKELRDFIKSLSNNE